MSPVSASLSPARGMKHGCLPAQASLIPWKAQLLLCFWLVIKQKQEKNWLFASHVLILPSLLWPGFSVPGKQSLKVYVLYESRGPGQPCHYPSGVNALHLRRLVEEPPAPCGDEPLTCALSAKYTPERSPRHLPVSLTSSETLASPPPASAKPCLRYTILGRE